MKESIFENFENNKTDAFKKNSLLNELLGDLKQLLSNVQREKEKEFNESRWPVGLIVGNPRSGTTLFLQWIASLKLFSYPSNVLTRFAYAPYIGGLIQKMIFDESYDFNNELADIRSKVNFESNLGKSKGALGANEFQHFFRNYMANFDPEYLSPEEIKQVDFTGIRKGLASIESAFGKPFITKAIILQYNIKELYAALPRLLFFWTKRATINNMQSILLARKKYYGNQQIWWSAKPREYELLKEMDIYYQIAGQVYFTNKTIEDNLKSIPSENKIVIEYERFCQSPEHYYNKILEMYDAFDYKVEAMYNGPEMFDVNDTITLSNRDIKKFEDAYEYFVSENIDC